MSKSCAICLRGICLDDKLEINQFGVSKKLTIKNVSKAFLTKLYIVILK